jgi:hypothetical protein
MESLRRPQGALSGSGIEARAGEQAVVEAASQARLDDGRNRRHRRGWSRDGRAPQRATVALANKEALVSAAVS